MCSRILLATARLISCLLSLHLDSFFASDDYYLPLQRDQRLFALQSYLQAEHRICTYIYFPTSFPFSLGAFDRQERGIFCTLAFWPLPILDTLELCKAAVMVALRLSSAATIAARSAVVAAGAMQVGDMGLAAATATLSSPLPSLEDALSGIFGSVSLTAWICLLVRLLLLLLLLLPCTL